MVPVARSAAEIRVRRHDVDAAAQHAPHRVAYRRNEEQDAEDVGQEAGQEKQQAGEQDHRAVHQFAPRKLAALGDVLYAPERAEPLHAHEHAAGDRGGDDQRDRGDDADMAAHHDEGRDLGERPGENQDRDEKSQKLVFRERCLTPGLALPRIPHT